jgi:hypothetical protein
MWYGGKSGLQVVRGRWQVGKSRGWVSGAKCHLRSVLLVQTSLPVGFPREILGFVERDQTRPQTAAASKKPIQDHAAVARDLVALTCASTQG